MKRERADLCRAPLRASIYSKRAPGLAAWIIHFLAARKIEFRSGSNGRKFVITVSELRPDDRQRWQDLFTAYNTFYQRNLPGETYERA